MKLKIEITMDNAAFDERQGDECARILRALADTLDGNAYLGGLNHRGLIDLNGNRVGEAQVTK